MIYGGHLGVDYSFIKHLMRLHGGDCSHIDMHA